MTGREHYQAAERLLNVVGEQLRVIRDGMKVAPRGVTTSDFRPMLDAAAISATAAQVHATLALAVASDVGERL